MKTRLYDEYIRRLILVNDETKTVDEHNNLLIEFNAWQQGVKDASGHHFNGDYYYIDLFECGVMIERPICLGVFLDWEYKSD